MRNRFKAMIFISLSCSGGLFGLIASATAATSIGPGDPTNRVVAFDIASQPLNDAVGELAEQADVSVAFYSDLGRGMRSRRLAGTFTPQRAFSELLADTPLRAEFVDPRSVVIREAASDVSKNGARGAANDSVLQIAAAGAPVQAVPPDSTTGDQPTYKDNGLASDTTNKKKSDLEEVVVTGTHIRGTYAEASPVTSYSRSDLDRSGATTTDQFMRTIPQNFADVDGTTSAEVPTANGKNTYLASGVDLHGLGSGATLVLLDGQRLAPSGSDGSFVDISMIPFSALERVDVLEDGASAIYGSDAVAGVVNFVLRKDLEGSITSARYGAATNGGAAETMLSESVGHRWGAGNILGAFEYDDQQGLRSDQRDFIPDQGSTYLLVPQQIRTNGLVKVQEDFSPGFTGFASGLFGRRTFAQDTPQGGVPLSNSGTATVYDGSAGLSVDLTKEWRADLVGNYGSSKQSSLLAEPTFDSTSPSRQDASLWSVSLVSSGPILALPAGDLNSAIGGEYRHETFDDDTGGQGTGLKRAIWSTFGELLIPVVGPANVVPLVSRLSLTAAARYSDYSEIGSTFNPKFGILWQPIDGLKLRGTWGTSFRAPPLANLTPNSPPFSFQEYDIPNSNVPGGSTVTLINNTPGNPSLRPETAHTLTVGFDIQPSALPNLTISATYFNVSYRNRIAGPPIAGTIFQFYDQYNYAVLAPFVNFSPNPATVANIYAQNNVYDGTDMLVGAAGVQAIADLRLQNIATSKTSGSDVTASYKIESRIGTIGIVAAASYLDELSFQATPNSQAIDLAGTVYNPPHFRARTGANWSLSGLSSTITTSYIGGSKNNQVTPLQSVSSWTTLDWQIAYNTPDRAGFPFSGISTALSILNILDAKPPFVASNNPVINLGYDAANASAVGRFISLQISKRLP